MRSLNYGMALEWQAENLEYFPGRHAQALYPPCSDQSDSAAHIASTIVALPQAPALTTPASEAEVTTYRWGGIIMARDPKHTQKAKSTIRRAEPLL